MFYVMTAGVRRRCADPDMRGQSAEGISELDKRRGAFRKAREWRMPAIDDPACCRAGVRIITCDRRPRRARVPRKELEAIGKARSTFSWAQLKYPRRDPLRFQSAPARFVSRIAARTIFSKSHPGSVSAPHCCGVSTTFGGSRNGYPWAGGSSATRSSEAAPACRRRGRRGCRLSFCRQRGPA